MLFLVPREDTEVYMQERLHHGELAYCLYITIYLIIVCSVGFRHKIEGL